MSTVLLVFKNKEKKNIEQTYKVFFVPGEGGGELFAPGRDALQKLTYQSI